MAKDGSGRKLPKGIRLLNSGNYQGRICYHGNNYTVVGATVSDVKSKMAEMKYELENGIFCKPDKMTFEKWFEEWLTTYKSQSCKIGTIITYRKHYSAYLREKIGKIQLQDLRTEHLQRLLNDMAADGYSDNTITLVCMVLSGCLKTAYKLNYIKGNPYEHIFKPKGEETSERVCFTIEQEKTFIEYLKGSYLENLFLLTLATGMRGGEVRGLLWENVDFKDKLIHVKHNLVDLSGQGGGWYLDTPKNKYGVRDIPMNEMAYKVLRKQKNYYDALHYSENIKLFGGKDDFVFFCDIDNEPISRKRVTYEIERMLEEMKDNGVDFPYYTLHCLRHTFATRCLDAGMDMRTLQKILGHGTLSMTVDLYGGHVITDRKKSEMEKVEESGAFKYASNQ